MRINWIMAGANMSGGTKSNRLIAEAMVRRGHAVNIVYSTAGRRSPGLRHPRQWVKWWIRKLAERRNPPRHHLERSTAQLIAVDHSPICAEDVPDGDVVIGTWWETMEWIRDWPESKGKKAYFVRHYEIHGGEPGRVRATYRLGVLKLVIAKWLQRLMAEEFGDSGAVLVPNGVDREQFDAEARGKQAEPTVGIVYSHQGWKGMDTAFEALRLAQEKMPSLRVVAFASKEIGGEVSLPANFEFHLCPEQGELAGLYSSVDCWVVSSTSEGFGMPGLEAAACRCPIVSTKCGGPEDYVVDGETGFLVEVGDARGMAEAILKVVGQSEERWRAMSESSYLKSLEFDWDKSAEILERALAGYVGCDEEVGVCESISSSEAGRMGKLRAGAIGI